MPVIPRAFIPILPHLLLLLSGASGLGCQIVWTRQLTGGLGQELPAVLAVVAAFFAGLALGAALLDRRIVTTANPARWYGGLEMAIGLWTATTAWLIPWLNEQLGPAIGLTPSPLRHWGLAFAGPLLALLPATAALGATLPAMVRWAAALRATSHGVGSLYAANTAGAVVGAVAGALWLIPEFGFQGTLLLLASASLVCGFTALALSRCAIELGGTARAANGRVKAGETSPSILVLAGTGLLGIGYEVLTVRLLAEVFTDTVFTFAMVLAVFLVGTAAGAFGERYWFRHHDPADRLRKLLAGLAASGAGGAALLTTAPEWLASLGHHLGNRATGAILAEAVVAAIVLVPPTLFMGATFAALAEWQRYSDGRVGRAVAWNTLGGTLAPLVFGVVVFPLVGGRWAFTSLIAGYLGLSLIRPPGSTPARRAIMGPAAVGMIALLVAALFAADSRRLLRPAPGEQLVAVQAGAAATAVVVATPDQHRTLRVNNRFTMGGTASASAERRHSHLPLLLHEAPRRALFLGVGTGISFGAMAVHRDLVADGVELSDEVAAVMGAFDAESGRPEWAGRLTLHLADARRFVRATPHRYDVIVADLFHPARDGAGNLYTREHFAALRDRLNPGGLVCQWLPLYQLDRDTLRLIIRTFLAVFPEAQAWLLRPNLDTPVVGLVGSTSRRAYPPDWMASRAEGTRLRSALQPLALTDTVQLLGSFLTGRQALGEYAGQGPLNTDDRPLVTFWAARGESRPNSAGTELLFDLIGLPLDDAGDLVSEAEDAAPFRNRLQSFIAARDDYLRGLAAEDKGRQDAAVAFFLASARRSPDFTTGYARALTHAMRLAAGDPSAARQLLEDLAAARPEQPVARRLLEELARRAHEP
ncbi:MAG: spermidine synthase [Verrucomicrobia bacterium]|nr:spermidine synthase [Verrucomicrobiota bacterium]